MKVKCENVVVCGNYKCELNLDGACIRTVIALDADGKCSLFRQKEKVVKTEKPALTPAPKTSNAC